MLLPSTLILLISFGLAGVRAGDVGEGGSCTTGNNRLQTGTYQFYGDCDSVTYCASDNVCRPRGCKKDDFPFGYLQDDPNTPDKCPRGQFCPDEGDKCQPLLPVGSDCQLNRDDECEAPPNFRELTDTSSRGLNVNGSVCLHNKCMWANATLGTACVVENTAYIGYGGGTEFNNIVSRGNCVNGLYCDSQSLVCMQNLKLGESCSADKQCDSWNCMSSNVCGNDQSVSAEVGSWVYAVVAIAILVGMLGTLFGLFMLHRKNRDQEREKRAQYWREQNAFHQNLLQMRDSARASILSLPGNAGSVRSTMYGGNGSDESHAPILNQGAPKGSGLRYLADDGSEYEDGMQPPPRNDGRF